FSIANEDQIQEIGSKVRDIHDKYRAQILRLILNTDHTDIDQRQSFAANLNPWPIFGQIAVAMKHLHFTTAGENPHTKQRIVSGLSVVSGVLASACDFVRRNFQCDHVKIESRKDIFARRSPSANPTKSGKIDDVKNPFFIQIESVVPRSCPGAAFATGWP